MKQARDQLLHFLTAILFLYPAARWPECHTFALAGLGLGAMREIGEHAHPLNFKTIWASLTTWDAPLDLTFWALGGFAVSAIVFH